MSEKFLKVEDLVVEYRTGGKVVHAVNDPPPLKIFRS